MQALESGAVFHDVRPSRTRQVPWPARAAEQTTTLQRGHAINFLAWEFFTTPANISVAETYLRDARGIDVGALCEPQGGEPIVGFARTEYRGMTRYLHRLGVTDTELLEPAHPDGSSNP